MLKIIPQSPQKSLSAELVRFSPPENEFINFKTALETLKNNIDEADRENRQEIYILNFLNDAFYRGRNYINKKDDIDLAIHADKDLL
ncbi:MAG: DUF7149 domain-containing protein [Pyrinomonadaceae bacterium]